MTLRELNGKVKRYVHNVHPIWILFSLCGLNLLVMHYYILNTCKLDGFFDIVFFIDNFVAVCFDILVIYYILYLLSFRRTKWALSLCFIITWLWSFSSVMYSRFFFHYLSLSAINQGDALTDDLILQCVKANFHFYDLYYPFAASLYVLFFMKMQKRLQVLPVRRVIIGFLMLLFVDFGAHVSYCLCQPPFRYVGYITHRIYNNQFVSHLYYSNPKMAHFLRGEVRTICAEMISSIRGNIKLTEDQLSEINSAALQSKNSLSASDKDFSSKNVIFILVESFMSFTSDMKVGGKEVTPFLNSLKKDSTVFYNGKIKKNVTLGGSFDGQFIYMTGLLPLRSVITLTKARNITLPGLPKVLGRESRMVIPTVTSIWNQDEMCRQYAFDKLYARNDYSSELSANLTDEQVFQLAIQRDQMSSQPFFSVILTISMHQPYEQQIDSTFIIKDPAINDELANYLNVCHYTDRQIEKYFNHLIESGLYDNSLIIIAADHPVDNTDFGGVINDIPLYIVNAGVDPHSMWHGECNQVDVYTTILDLLGCKSDWYGLGCSLVSTKYDNSVYSHKWDISEWIIMGDYFSKE